VSVSSSSCPEEEEEFCLGEEDAGPAPTVEPVASDAEVAAYEAARKLPPSIGSPAYACRSTVRRVLLVYNPRSGARRGERIMLAAKRLLERQGVQVTALATQRAGHAEELARTADLRAVDVLCVLGGDGSMHEAVNGFMRRADFEEVRRRVPLALIAGGTGNSFALELQGSTRLRHAVATIARGLHVPIDIARITMPHSAPANSSATASREAREEVLYCFNSLHWGLGSKVNVTAERLRWMGNAVRYTTAALLELVHGSLTPATVLYEDRDGVVHELTDRFCLVIANNIMSAAKGMKMAPQARLNDGLIDLLLITSYRPTDLFQMFRKVYEGTHVDLPYVKYLQVRRFSITPFRPATTTTTTAAAASVLASSSTACTSPTASSVAAAAAGGAEAEAEVSEELVDIDGELKGSTPFRCDVVPLAIRVIV
jgi:diacylglycerol kinase family enzyme